MPLATNRSHNIWRVAQPDHAETPGLRKKGGFTEMNSVVALKPKAQSPLWGLSHFCLCTQERFAEAANLSWATFSRPIGLKRLSVVPATLRRGVC